MQEYQVPQFIAIEDRIIGPLTLKQFLYLLGAAGIGLLGWFFLHVVLFVILAIPLAGLLTSMAFAKINGRPFPDIFFGAISYYVKPRLYLWRPLAVRKPSVAQAPAQNPPPAITPQLSESRLAELAWSLDIKEKLER